jgi:NAD(P)-dependent dehydrogenase (short-subunit alcohol dehydrogenase family)
MTSVLITGANRGIGLALARRMAGRGDEVVAVCRKSSPELSGLGVHVEAGIDLASDGTIEELSARLGQRSFDVLLLNAGILKADGLDTLGLDTLREQLEVNALGPLRVVLALRRTLRRGSKIALITSRMGSIGDNTSGGYYGYRMSKAALNAAGMSLANDLRSIGVAVVTLHPGYVRTDMTGGSGTVAPDEAARLLLERVAALTLETTGQFLHANGEPLPW